MNKKTRERFDKQVSFLGLASIEKRETGKLCQKDLAALQGGGHCHCDDDSHSVDGVMYDGW